VSDATRLVDDVMRLPIHKRAELYAESKSVRTTIAKATGTPWFIWIDSPVSFVENVLGEATWAGQRAILQSCWDHDRTAVAACHAPGKTHIAARAVAWFVATRPFGTAQVVTTAPTWRQVKNLLWPHIRRLHGLRGFPGRIGENAEWRIGEHLAAFGFSPSDYDESAAQGIHSNYVMVVVDEAGGISRARFQALEGVMSAGFARMLAIGNPATDDETTPFEERWHSPTWNGLRIAALDTPNFTGEVTGPCSCIESRFRPHHVAEHLTQPKWVEQVREEFGEDSAYYVARVLAQFPHGITQRTIPWAFIEAAQERDRPTVDSDLCALGVDVASDGGDELAFAVARGWDVQFLEGRAGEENADPIRVAHRVRQHIEGGSEVGWEGLIAAQRRLNPTRRAQVKIDAIGLGWGVTGTIRAWASEFMWPVEIVGVQVGERPNSAEGQKKYLNKRAEMWWTARDLLKDTVRLTAPKRAVAQLAGPMYDITSAGLIKIESKDDMRRRGLQSPDEAEAVLLAIYPGVSAGRAVASAQAMTARLPGVRRRN
jgi:hypothetical protein